MVKIIVLGAPLTGKTTLANYFRENSKTPVLDFDDELMRLNNGVWPGDDELLNEKLKAKVMDSVIGHDEVIFVAFTFDHDKLRQARAKGFRTVQLIARQNVLKERHDARLLTDPDKDIWRFMSENLSFQQSLRQEGLIDDVIDANCPVEKLAVAVLG